MPTQLQIGLNEIKIDGEIFRKVARVLQIHPYIRRCR